MNKNGNPSKKPRWDSDFNDFEINGDPFDDDDLWGHGELTAEEFDLVEIQATQKFNKAEDMVASQNEQEQLKEQQYALEGQIKLLSDSLDKTVRELNVERQNREGIISEKISEFKKNECHLRKEVERMQTVIQFKDQEMKSIQNKLHSSEIKLRDQLNESQLKISPGKNTSSIFLNRFNFDANNISTKDSAAQTLQYEKDNDDEQWKLPLKSPADGVHYSNSVSCFLTTRRFKQLKDKRPCDPLSQNCFVAFAHLNVGHATEELWQYFETTLKQHILFLQQLKTSGPRLKKASIAVDVPGTSAQLTSNEEIEKHHAMIRTCLDDLRLLPNVNCVPPFGQQKSNRIEITSDMDVENKNDSIEMHDKEKHHVFALEHLASDFPKNRLDYSCSELLKCVMEPDITSHSCPLFKDDEKTDSHPGPSQLSPLLTLVKPDTYPDYYIYKKEELCHALSVLVQWSRQKCMSLDRVLYIVPVQKLVSGLHGITCACLTLHLLSQILFKRSIEGLLHQSENCLFSTIANLCQSISAKENEYIYAVSSIQSFLCQCLASMGSSCINDESCCCSAELAQGLIIMQWNFHKVFSNTLQTSSTHIETLRQGISLLHQLFTKTKDFATKKIPVADQYVTLIYELSKLSRDCAQLKNLQDTIQDLWDFQQDFSDDEHMVTE